MNDASRRIHFVSLGCSKNRVDSEVMLGVAEEEGYLHTSQPSEADVIVVNTCGFVEAARKESIDTILELGQEKSSGRCQRLVVTGCLSQAHSEELSEGLPEVDHFLGSSDMLKLRRVLKGDTQRILVGNPADWLVGAADPRRLSTRGASAYIKLAEGCNKSCSFCIIPQLRGKQRSRPPDDVVAEVEQLCSSGVKEINLISQDTIAYGRDLQEPSKLASVVRRVADVPGVHWVRIFYLYPERIDPELMELFAEHPRVVPYLDMPLQHASDAMLKRMRRPWGGLLELVESMRSRIDGLTFRSAFILGHPGETKEDFEQLKSFVKTARFERLGLFQYSDEAESHSATLGDKVPPQLAVERLEELAALQHEISRAKNAALVGSELEVLVEGQSDENEWVMTGRHAGQAPEIDGMVYLSEAEVRPGQIVSAHITQAVDYDLLGEVSAILSTDSAKQRRATTSDGKIRLKTIRT